MIAKCRAIEASSARVVYEFTANEHTADNCQVLIMQIIQPTEGEAAPIHSMLGQFIAAAANDEDDRSRRAAAMEVLKSYVFFPKPKKILSIMEASKGSLFTEVFLEMDREVVRDPGGFIAYPAGSPIRHDMKWTEADSWARERYGYLIQLDTRPENARQ